MIYNTSKRKINYQSNQVIDQNNRSDNQEDVDVSIKRTIKDKNNWYSITKKPIVIESEWLNMEALIPTQYDWNGEDLLNEAEDYSYQSLEITYEYNKVPLRFLEWFKIQFLYQLPPSIPQAFTMDYIRENYLFETEERSDGLYKVKITISVTCQYTGMVEPIQVKTFISFTNPQILI